MRYLSASPALPPLPVLSPPVIAFHPGVPLLPPSPCFVPSVFASFTAVISSSSCRGATPHCIIPLTEKGPYTIHSTLQGSSYLTARPTAQCSAPLSSLFCTASSSSFVKLIDGHLSPLSQSRPMIDRHSLTCPSIRHLGMSPSCLPLLRNAFSPCRFKYQNALLRLPLVREANTWAEIRLSFSLKTPNRNL